MNKKYLLIILSPFLCRQILWWFVLQFEYWHTSSYLHIGHTYLLDEVYQSSLCVLWVSMLKFMFKSLLFLTTSLTLAFGFKSNIVNGEDAKQGQFPYQVCTHFFQISLPKFKKWIISALLFRYLGIVRMTKWISVADLFIQKT